MKKKNTKKSFKTFDKRSANKRRGTRAKNELLRAVMETNVGTDALKISDSVDGGRRHRSSDKRRRDEIVAEGVFSSSKSGFGFVSIEGLARDVFIPEGKTGGAIDGDSVEIVYHKYKNYLNEEKTEGRVRRILAHGRTTVIGTVDEEEYYYSRRALPIITPVLIPDDRKISEVFKITDLCGASLGDKVEAEILRSEGGATCRVLRSFGKAEEKEANYSAILAEYGIEPEFTKEELLEAEFFASMPLSEEGRVLRSEVIFTIDGAGAKDLDDAVSLKKTRGGWQLGVHIADVSAYVKERTHLDRASMARGTSVYFTDKVVPMLPPALSNGACSLNAGEEKYTLSAIINLTPEGEIKSVKIEPSTIKSRVRGVYSEVNEILENTASPATRVKYKEVIPSLLRMHELYLLLARRIGERGSLELETSEAEIVLDSEGRPIDIIKRTRGDAEKMIEQFMLTANEAVARFLSERGVPCVYRIHENPPPERLAELVLYLHNLGFDTRAISSEKATAADFAALLAEANRRDMLPQVSYAMLRSMAKAKYLDQRRAHFGLSLEYYCHFTSPIRRLSDLATHRIIHKVILEGKRPELYAKYAHRAAAAATEAEERAIGAERRIENLYKVLYMMDKVGCEFDATVNSIQSFGLFAELDNTCEGLVPISSLPGMFTFDEKNIALRSRSKIYHVADKVRVRLEEADIIRGKLRFSIVD